MIEIPCQQGESVVIGDDIIISGGEIRDDEVHLGIESPKGTSFLKGEEAQQSSRQPEVASQRAV